MSTFFNRLNYSFGNEDWETEKKALKLQPKDRVVCITASGDRPLNLLMKDCQEIIAVDMNPYQNYLLKLKAAAMHHLDFQDYQSFLGNKDSSHRKSMLLSLFPLLSSDAVAYWKSHQRDIQKGILYQGALEKWTTSISFFIKTFRKDKRKRLFDFDDLEQQKLFVQQEWASPSWRKAFDVILNPFVTRFLLKDPGLHEFLDQSLHIGRYLHDRINQSLEKRLAKENLLISLLLLGKVLPEGYPPYLTEYGTNIIRKRLPKLSVVTINIIEYLEKIPESSIDVFSLSDVASYMDAKNFTRLAHAVARSAKPGARFCMRQFLSNHKIPQQLQSTLKRDHTLEHELEDDDRCFVYRFLTGTIQK